MAFSRELPHSFGEALRAARDILQSNPYLVSRNLVDTEAEQLVVAAYRMDTGDLLSRIAFYSRIKDRFPASAAQRLLILAGSRAEGKLLQHLIGFQVFLDHEYEVGPDVLVPRPETEVLLRAAISEFSLIQTVPSLGLEIGIGSGVLSIELLSHYPKLVMTASELTQVAEKRARKNAEKILGPGLDGSMRLKTVLATDPTQVWQPFQSTPHPVLADFLITNPPYLILGDGIDEEVLSHEPQEALFAPGQDPLFFYRAIEEQSEKFIKKKGYVFAEVPHERAAVILKLFEASRWDAKLIADLNRRDRVLIAKLKGNNG